MSYYICTQYKFRIKSEQSLRHQLGFNSCQVTFTTFRDSVFRNVEKTYYCCCHMQFGLSCAGWYCGRRGVGKEKWYVWGGSMHKHRELVSAICFVPSVYMLFMWQVQLRNRHRVVFRWMGRYCKSQSEHWEKFSDFDLGHVFPASKRESSISSCHNQRDGFQRRKVRMGNSDLSSDRAQSCFGCHTVLIGVLLSGCAHSVCNIHSRFVGGLPVYDTWKEAQSRFMDAVVFVHHGIDFLSKS